MKKLVHTIHFLTQIIKKNFFNEKEGQICKNSVSETLFYNNANYNDKETEEYLLNYNNMTRWQTV